MEGVAAWTLQYCSALATGTTPVSRCDAATVVEASARYSENRVAGNSCREYAQLVEWVAAWTLQYCSALATGATPVSRCGAATVVEPSARYEGGRERAEGDSADGVFVGFYSNAYL